MTGSEGLLSYLDRIHQKTQDDRPVDPKVRSAILTQLNEACSITALNFDELLKGLDFKPGDLSIEALEAFLAELRAIFWLDSFGFTNIKPLYANSSPQPDFTASYKNKTCAIEVFCLTHAHEQMKDGALGVYKNFDPQMGGSKFGRDFFSKANVKKRQLDSSNSAMKLLLCVINSQPIVNLNTHEEMRAHAEYLYKRLGWSGEHYLGLLTGARVNGFLTDALFPAIDN